MLTRFTRSAALAVLLVGSFMLGTLVNPIARGAESDGFATFLQVYDLIKSEYVERNIDETKLREGAIRGLLESLGDPYTRYMDSKSFGSMQEERQGSFSGIGIQIGIRDKHLTVIAPIEDTPAWRAGLKPGDWIMEIDGRSTKDMSDAEASSLIRGRVGSSVRLLIQRADQPAPFEVKIVRGIIETKAVAKPKLFDSQIAYIRLITFMKNETPAEMRKALESLRGYKALILDLRSNPGGLLQNAVEVTSMFVPKGTVVRIVGREGETQSLNATGRTLVPSNIPMVVLIDSGSASASEIVSGALQDLHRATLIGTKSFGKGLVQTVHALSDGSGVAITTNKYLTSNGHDINKRGIIPDVVVEPPREQEVDTKASPSPSPRVEMDEEARIKADVQLQTALSYLKDQIALSSSTTANRRSP